MPRRASLFLAGLSLVLTFAACNNGGSSVTPTPGPTASTSPNPKDRSAQIDVSILGTPAPKIPVEMSTPRNGRPGHPIATKTTGPKGSVIFYGLNVNKTYCWKALLSASSSSYFCGNWTFWQFQPISIGT